MQAYNFNIPTANTTFLGGGINALTFLLFASKTSKLYELISKKGVQIIEKTTSFGPGNLEKYSNFIRRNSF